MEEEKKNNKGLIIVIVIILSLCLIVSIYFIYMMISSNNDSNNNQSKENIVDKISLTSDEIDNILNLVPVKTVSSNFVGFNVSELTDLDINNLLCTYIENNSLNEKVDDGVMMEKSKSLDVITSFLNLKDYKFNNSVGNTDIRYKLEEVKKDNKVYYKLVNANIATDAFDIYKYIYLNDYSCNNETKECIIKTEVKGYMGGGPVLKLGTANIYITKDNKINLQKVEFNKYDENIIEQ